MSILSFIEGLVKPVTSLVDDLVTSDEERLTIKNELTKLENDWKTKALDFEKNVIDKKAEVMIAELKQDDKFTKRARPTILYAGLVILATNHVLLPWVNHFIGNAPPTIDIPPEFWYAWGGVAGIYSFKRSDEKIRNTKNGS